MAGRKAATGGVRFQGGLKEGSIGQLERRRRLIFFPDRAKCK